MRHSTFLLTAALCCAAVSVIAQKTPYNAFHIRNETLWFADTARSREKNLELGLLFGGVYYRGDLSNDDHISAKNTTPTIGGIYLRRHLWPFLALKFSFLGGKISSEDLAYPDRNTSFETSLRELSLQAEWEPFGKQRFRHIDTSQYILDRYHQFAMINKFRRVVSPYLFLGGAAVSSNAKTTFDRVYSEASNLMARVEQDQRDGAGWRNNFGLSFGAGVHFDLGRNWILGLEGSARTTYSDYLDGVGQAGNPDKFDWYWLGALHIAYRIGKHDRDGDGVADSRDKCPEIPGRGRSHGCPDADNDGIADDKDECPHRAGIVALAGCPLKDADNDSVPDVDDLCPKVWGKVKFKGCPDTDNDDVEDKLDSCVTVAGLPQFNGCPDTDSDGVEDKLDTCPTVAGLAQFKGCPDTDEDGIEDKLDQCPTEKGIPEYDGCAWRDTDRDSIEDRLDPCPLVAGLAKFFGCPDTDHDGVQDRLDLCPNMPGKAENRGCPVVEKKDQKKLDLAVKAVKFETGKAILKPESSKILTDIADILVKYEGYYLRIEGHTDNVGKDETNQKLSEARALACLDFLVKKGVKADRIASAGFGETKPVADNKTATGKTLNRRVEFNLFLPE